MLKQVLETEIAKTSLSSGARHPATELEALVAIFLEALNGHRAEDVAEAFRVHRRECPFMPRPSEILARAKDIAARRRARVRQLPPPVEISDDQLRINREGLAKVRAALRIKRVG
jgi:hypothetical protein